MKILRIKNGIEYKIPYHFNCRGLGVLYNDTTYKGRSQDARADGDAFDLQLGTDYIITNTPLSCIDRIGLNGPLGWKYAWPIVFKKGEKLTFTCRNSNIGEDDINLLLYGVPIPDDTALKLTIQKKPDRIIKLHGFFFPGDGSTTTQEFGFDKTIHLLSIANLYAEKLTGVDGLRFQDMPDSITGYYEIVGHLYYIFDDKPRPLNLISDQWQGYRAETKWFNVKKITIPENDLLTLKLKDPLTYHSSLTDGDQNLWTVLEYSDAYQITKAK
jgi:hypothetical protein